MVVEKHLPPVSLYSCVLQILTIAILQLTFVDEVGCPDLDLGLVVAGHVAILVILPQQVLVADSWYLDSSILMTRDKNLLIR